MTLVDRVIKLTEEHDIGKLPEVINYMTDCSIYYACYVEKPQASLGYVARQDKYVLEQIKMYLETGKANPKIMEGLK